MFVKGVFCPLGTLIIKNVPIYHAQTPKDLGVD